MPRATNNNHLLKVHSDLFSVVAIEGKASLLAEFPFLSLKTHSGQKLGKAVVLTQGRIQTEVEGGGNLEMGRQKHSEKS